MFSESSRLIIFWSLVRAQVGALILKGHFLAKIALFCYIWAVFTETVLTP